MRACSIALRRLYVSGLWLQGVSIRDICAALRQAGIADVSQKTIQDDLAQVRKPWTDEAYWNQLKNLGATRPSHDIKKGKQTR